MDSQVYLPEKRDAPASGLKGAGALSTSTLRNLLGYQLKRAQINVYDSFAMRLRQLNLTPGHFGVLLLIGANPGATQRALADTIGCNRSLIVRILDQFERHGLVVRNAVPKDRRSHAICPTPKGQRLIEKLKREVVEHELQATSHLSRREAKLLQVLLQRLNSADRRRRSA